MNHIVRLKLKEIRESKNISIEELASKTGISRITLWRYEAGSRMPNLQTAYALAYFLNSTLDELIEKAPQEEL